VCLRVSDEEDDPGDQQRGQIALGDGGVGDKVLGRGREKRQGGGGLGQRPTLFIPPRQPKKGEGGPV
jgi:hypothetical protein